MYTSVIISRLSELVLYIYIFIYQSDRQLQKLLKGLIEKRKEN